MSSQTNNMSGIDTRINLIQNYNQELVLYCNTVYLPNYGCNDTVCFATVSKIQRCILGRRMWLAK